MIPPTIESLFFIITLFLPGYIYRNFKAKFQYSNWQSSKTVLIDLIYASILLQIFALIVNKEIYNVDFLDILVKTYSNSKALSTIIYEIRDQTIIACFLAFSLALISSMKKVKRWFSEKIINKFNIPDFLNVGLSYNPALNAIFESESENHSKYIGCAIETKDGKKYVGSIKHVSFDKDKIIVIDHAITIDGKNQKQHSDELKILIPYDQIKAIFYKPYPIKK